MFSTLNHGQMTKKLHTYYHTRFHVLNVVRISKMLYSKMEGKTLKEKIKKSVQRIFRFRFIREKFLKISILILIIVIYTIYLIKQ